jgi:hypothetical protein
MINELANRTAEQKEEHIKYFISLPLKELRKRQTIIESSKSKIFEMHQQDLRSPFEHVRNKLKDGYYDPAYEQLDIMWYDLVEAIDRKCFPNPAKAAVIL